MRVGPNPVPYQHDQRLRGSKQAGNTWLGLVLLLATSCRPSSPPAFVGDARVADELVVYEGVPRDGGPTTEPKRRHSEPTVLLDGETFFARSLTVRGDEAHRLGTLLADKTVFTSHVDGKSAEASTPTTRSRGARKGGRHE